MDRINGTGTIDLGAGKRGFREENLPGGIQGTQVTAEWLNGLQEELLAVIEGAGFPANSAAWTQLYSAIRKLVQRQQSNYAVAGGTANALTVALSPAVTSLAELVGMPLRIRATLGNTGDVTVAVNGLAAIPVRQVGLPLPAGVVAPGDIVHLVYDGTVFQLTGVSFMAFTPVTLYVRSDGSDSNDGSANTAGSAFKTLQGCISAALLRYGVQRPLDIRLGIPGTYAAPTTILSYANVSITGDPGSPAAYIIAGGAAGVNVLSPQSMKVSVIGCNLRCDYTSRRIISAANGATFGLSNCVLSSTLLPYSLIAASVGAQVTISGNITITTGATYAFESLQGGQIFFDNTATITFSGGPTFSGSTVIAADLSVLTAQTGATFIGSVTGKRYQSNNLSLIQTSGAGINLFPGTIAGTVANGGVYV